MILDEQVCREYYMLKYQTQEKLTFGSYFTRANGALICEAQRYPSRRYWVTTMQSNADARFQTRKVRWYKL